MILTRAHPHFPGSTFRQRGVRLALLALSVVLAFAQVVVNNANDTSLTPLVPATMTNKSYYDQTGKMEMRPLTRIVKKGAAVNGLASTPFYDLPFEIHKF